MVDEDQYEQENYGTQYPVERFEEELRGAFPRPLSTRQLADRVACTPPTAKTKLEALRRHGVIDRTTVGNNTYVYYLVNSPC